MAIFKIPMYYGKCLSVKYALEKTAKMDTLPNVLFIDASKLYLIKAIHSSQ